MATHAFHEQFPLPSDEKSIRVLCIQPGVKGTTIEASLFKIDLDNPNRPPYTTLSYAWGDATIVDYILVNDEKTGVGANLFQALQHVRSPDEPIVIWVDAVCIDQTDNIEKSHQVAHMGLVYKLCEQVYIWLGVPEGSTPVESNPFALVEHFAADKHFYELPGYRKDTSTDTWTLDVDNAENISIWEGFKLVSQSPWWRRAWTVQEAVLPAKAVFMCGTWRNPWETFDLFEKKTRQHTRSHTESCCVGALDALNFSQKLLFSQIIWPILTLEHSRCGTQLLKTLSDVSSAYKYRQCSDPRDKIYSLLGLVESAKTDVYPDYTKEVSEVYVDAFCNILEESEMSPQCLLGEGFHSERFNLPSWVRDFSLVFDARLQFRRAREEYHLFKACGPLSGKLEVKDRKQLRTHGIFIDRVKAMATSTFHAGSGSEKKTLDDWRRTCNESGVTVRTDQANEVFARVLCGGAISRGGERARLLEENNTDLPTDSEWSEFWATGNESALPRRYTSYCGAMMDRKTLYVTFSGRIGLSFPKIKVGDEVWVIHGSNVPFILRRQSETPAWHRFLGETYLHDVMHGSCAKEDSSVQVVLV